jgi:hypothetical protein
VSHNSKNSNIENSCSFFKKKKPLHVVSSMDIIMMGFLRFNVHYCKNGVNTMNGVVIGWSCCLVIIEVVFVSALCTLMLLCACKQFPVPVSAPTVIWLPGLPHSCLCVGMSICAHTLPSLCFTQCNFAATRFPLLPSEEKCHLVLSTCTSLEATSFGETC